MAASDMAADDQNGQWTCALSVEPRPGRLAAQVETPDLEGYDEDVVVKETVPTEIDAGAQVTLVGTIACSPARDLRGQSILVQDQEGTPRGEAQVVDFDGEISRTAELAVDAPTRTGEHRWLAVLPAHTADGIDYEEVSAPFTLTVRAHATNIAVWDVPTAIVAGDAFHFKVGVKCSSECRPAGWTFNVSDEHGVQVAAGALSDEPWPGTEALYHAEVEARAPGAEGLHDWSVKAPGPHLDIPHEEQTARFGIRSVPRPECLISVEAIDKESQSPIEGARVVVHPYRVFTDDRGRAQVRVPKGTYRIFVSGSGHVPFRTECEVAADTSIRAELILDRELTDADLWS